MHRIFISDLHLEALEAPAALRFRELLTAESERVDEIYILGDLVEMWVGDDDDSDIAVWLTQTLAECSVPVYVMHGNRDFLFKDQFANQAQVQLIPDPYIAGKDLYLCHGDSLCTDDQEYQTLRAMFRSEAWQHEILAKSLIERQAFGNALRAQSRVANANKASNIMDINEGALLEAVQPTGVDTVIHGHTHRPGHHQHAGNIRRYVLGAWEKCGWLCRQRNHTLQLECFSLARRYEI
ncbi:MAG: UDP-2,3-diacylglucosamine diphosphatase [Pseudomonadota bacterium]